MKRVLRAITVFALALVCAFSAAACGNKAQRNASSWHIGAYVRGEEAVIQKTGFYVSRNNVPVRDIWIKIDSVDNGISSTDITFVRFSGDLVQSSTYSEITRTVTAAEIGKKANDGWFKVNTEDIKGEYSYFMFKSTGGITVNEVAFIGVDKEGKDKVLKAEIQKVDVWYKTTSGETRGTNVMTASELKNVDNSSEGLPSLLVDEQDKVEKTDFSKFQ